MPCILYDTHYLEPRSGSVMDCILMENSLATGSPASFSSWFWEDRTHFRQMLLSSALEHTWRKQEKLVRSQKPVEFGASVWIAAEHAADVPRLRLLPESKGNVKYGTSMGKWRVKLPDSYAFFVCMWLIGFLKI